MEFQPRDTNILLLHAPFNVLAFGKDWKRAETGALPLGLMYLADPLLVKGYNISFIDLNVDRYEFDVFSMAVRGMDFILISTYSASLNNVIKLIGIIRKTNPNAFIMCGGPYCTLTGKHVEGSNMTVVGEAEEIISDLIERIHLKKSLTDIPGLIYFKDGELVKNNGLLFVKDLNKTKHASDILAKNKDYGDYYGFRLERSAGVVSSRGCPYRCTYCTHRGVLPYRERSPENVVSELEGLQQQGVETVIFYDDNFLLNKSRVNKILDLLIEKKIKIRMALQTRVDSADRDLYQKLRRAGVFAITFGIESANQDILDFFKKDTNVNKIGEAVDMANEAGLLINGNFIIGAPFEDEKHFLINKKFVDKAPLDWIHVSILGYYQGSPLWDSALSSGLIKENETIVLANEKLSHYSYKDWCALRDRLVDGFITPSRISRFLYKSMVLGVFGMAIQVLWYKFFKKAYGIDDITVVDPTKMKS